MSLDLLQAGIQNTERIAVRSVQVPIRRGVRSVHCGYSSTLGYEVLITDGSVNLRGFINSALRPSGEESPKTV